MLIKQRVLGLRDLARRRADHPRCPAFDARSNRREDPSPPWTLLKRERPLVKVYPRYEREVVGVLIHIDVKRPLRFFTPG